MPSVLMLMLIKADEKEPPLMRLIGPLAKLWDFNLSLAGCSNKRKKTEKCYDVNYLVSNVVRKDDDRQANTFY